MPHVKYKTHIADYLTWRNVMFGDLLRTILEAVAAIVAALLGALPI
jgi:hypothetical protein